MVFEDVGILGKKRALLRCVNIGFNGDQALLADFVEYAVDHDQDFHVILLGIGLVAEDARDGAARGFDDFHGRGDDETSDGRTADDQNFHRLENDGQVAALQQVAANHSGADYDKADNSNHDARSLPPFFSEDFSFRFKNKADDFIPDKIINIDELHGCVIFSL